MERILAVYDVELEYAARFAEVSNQKESIPFTVMAFTSLEKLREYAGKHSVEVLLVGDEVEQEALEKLPVDRILRLREGEAVAEREGYQGVYKYQPSDAILREVMAYYGAEEEAVLEYSGRKNSHIIGVYSPVSGCLKTSFALTLGQLMALESRVLYLNLEAFSGFSALTKERYHRDLSDVLYFYKQGNRMGVSLHSLVYHLGQMDYIPPVRYPDDLNQVEAAEMAEIVKKISEEGGYHTLILDVGHYARKVEELLQICDRIYMPVKNDAVSAAKLEEWEAFLCLSKKQTILDRTKRLFLPSCRKMTRKEGYLEQLLWGELGDYTRQLLRGGGELQE
ncbi:MAG: hypothetical protein Q4D90_03315 [bacterium]|nr:hypothetical protein [bacterium]